MQGRWSRYITRVFYGTTLISFLSIAIPLAVQLTIKGSKLHLIGWYVTYSNLFVLFPIIAITWVIILIVDVKTYGMVTGVGRIVLQSLPLLVAVLIIKWGEQKLEYQSNQLNVTLQNNTNRTIRHITVYGRGALSQLESLPPTSDTTIVFRGKKIKYETGNDYDNEVTLLYYLDSTQFREPILQGFGRWRVFAGPLRIDLNGPDSVGVKYLSE